ncbi:MAG TPA: cupin domain-containing protein [Dehalococcoidia bacterium]
MERETAEVRVVRGAKAAGTGAASGAMARLPGVDAAAGATRLWLGLAVLPPGAVSAPHHHGEAETAAYVLRGRLRISYGEGFRRHVEAGPGDFIFVPAGLPHIEANASDAEPAEVLAARSPDNIVVNL